MRTAAVVAEASAAPTKPAEASATTAAVLIPDIRAVQHLGTNDRGATARKTQVVVAPHLAWALDPNLEFALNRVLPRRALEVTLHIERLHGAELVFSTKRLARVREERCTFGCILRAGAARERK